MAHPGKHPGEKTESPSSTTLLRSPDQTQLDFEIEFFGKILDKNPEYIDVLRIHGNNLSLKGRYAEGLQIDKKLVALRPADPLAQYNLACSFALLKKTESALKALRKAAELGYRDFRYMREDRDLDHIRDDPRFRKLLREFETR